METAESFVALDLENLYCALNSDRGKDCVVSQEIATEALCRWLMLKCANSLWRGYTAFSRAFGREQLELIVSCLLRYNFEYDIVPAEPNAADHAICARLQRSMTETDARRYIIGTGDLQSPFAEIFARLRGAKKCVTIVSGVLPLPDKRMAGISYVSLSEGLADVRSEAEATIRKLYCIDEPALCISIVRDLVEGRLNNHSPQAKRLIRTIASLMTEKFARNGSPFNGSIVIDYVASRLKERGIDSSFQTVEIVVRQLLNEYDVFQYCLRPFRQSHARQQLGV